MILSQLPTLVYTIAANSARHQRVTRLLTDLGFTNWRFEMGTPKAPGEHYWQPIRADYVAMLRGHIPPLMILEDDIAPRQYVDAIDIPPGADALYLGGGVNGELKGAARAKKELGLPFRRCHHFGFVDLGRDWIRIAGMYYSHAILWLTRSAMLRAADSIETYANCQVDVVFALEQWRWTTLCRKTPMFWQDDGHHREETYDYFPPANRRTPAELRRRRRRAVLRGERPASSEEFPVARRLSARIV